VVTILGYGVMEGWAREVGPLIGPALEASVLEGDVAAEVETVLDGLGCEGVLCWGWRTYFLDIGQCFRVENLLANSFVASARRLEWIGGMEYRSGLPSSWVVLEGKRVLLWLR